MKPLIVGSLIFSFKECQNHIWKVGQIVKKSTTPYLVTIKILSIPTFFSCLLVLCYLLIHLIPVIPHV